MYGQDIKVDQAGRTVTIQPGVTAGELLAATTPLGLYTSVPNLNGVGGRPVQVGMC